MADIKINDIKNLRPSGLEFFADDESYINELTEDELNVFGGGVTGVSASAASKSSVAVSSKSGISVSAVSR